MPARSNQFQRLVHAIETQAAPAGATVTESAMVEDPMGEPHEVDILVTAKVGLRDLRFAIEVQDRSRRGDQTWIEQIAGKYQSLGMSDVTAVAAKGFTKGAQRVARARGIRLLSLNEAERHPWMQEHIERMGGPTKLPSIIEARQVRLDPHNITLRVAAPVGRRTELTAEPVIILANGGRTDISGLCTGIINTPALLQDLALVEPVDVDVPITSQITLHDVHIEAADGSVHPLDGLTVEGTRVVDTSVVNLSHSNYGDAYVSFGQGKIGSMEFTIASVRTEGTSEPAPITIHTHPSTAPPPPPRPFTWQVVVSRET